MNPLEKAKELYVRLKDLAREARRELLKDEPEEVRAVYYDISKRSVFEHAHEVPNTRKEHVSPSGKYKLVTTRFNKKEGGWDYAQGEVFSLGKDEPIATVMRNYSVFPFSWIEDHPNGHAYLVAGEDYQGQTVIELDTGKRRDALSEGAEKGHGFCWSSHTFYPEHQLLAVDGCIWACPYEFRFYDFSDPMNGWPELECDECIEYDERKPTFDAEGIITCYQSGEGDSEGLSDDEEIPPGDLAAKIMFKREGNKLVRVGSWVSEAEKEHRRKQEEGRRKYDEWRAWIQKEDPLFLAMKEGLKDPLFSPSEYLGTGVTHEHWCPDFKVEERRVCKDIVTKGPVTMGLEWGADTGPVKLIIHRKGKEREDRFWMEHSVASIEAALAHARGLLGEASGG